MKTHRDIVEPIIKNIIAGISKGKVLEIGHGLDTQFKNLFIKQGLEYVGTDNYIGINNGLEKLSGKEYFYDKMEDLESFEDESFDIVFSCHAFEHCENPLEALREAKRVLKVGGRLIMVTPWPCKHHIIDKDFDHIFVLNQYQLLRLAHYAGFNKLDVMEQKDLNLLEQDFNIITVGEKE